MLGCWHRHGGGGGLEGAGQCQGCGPVGKGLERTGQGRAYRCGLASRAAGQCWAADIGLGGMAQHAVPITYGPAQKGAGQCWHGGLVSR